MYVWWGPNKREKRWWLTPGRRMNRSMTLNNSRIPFLAIQQSHPIKSGKKSTVSLYRRDTKEGRRKRESPQHSRPHNRKSLLLSKSRLNHLEAIEHNKDCCSIKQETSRRESCEGGKKPIISRYKKKWKNNFEIIKGRRENTHTHIHDVVQKWVEGCLDKALY